MSTQCMPLTYVAPLRILIGMSELNSERVITPMPKALVSAIDDFRFETRLPSRAEAIRRLIEIGLETARQDTKTAEDSAPKA